jgi:hypothetical protein
MMIALLLGTAAVVVGLARGGSLESLASTPLRWLGLLFGGLALQVAAALWSPWWLTPQWALLVVVLSNLAILLFIAANRRLPGMLIADLGVALNLLVIVVNGAMPVSAVAARQAGIETVPSPVALKHERMTDATALPWLGDIVPLPVVGEVLSIGDVLLAGGIARLVYARTTGADDGKAPTPSRTSGLRPAAGPAPPPSRRRPR